MIYVHFAKSAIRGGWVKPWTELSETEQRHAANLGSVHKARFPDQWHPDRVYIHQLVEGRGLFHLGTVYSNPEWWAYEVEPVLPLGPDPERAGHTATSLTCVRARIVTCLHDPTAPLR